MLEYSPTQFINCCQMKSFFRNLLSALLLCVGLQGCLSYFDVEEVEFEPWNPTIAIPLINSDLDINDLTDSLDQSFINTQQDGLVEFIYQDSLESFRIADLVDIPDFSVSESSSFPLPTLDGVTVEDEVAITTIFSDEVPLNDGVPIPAFSGASYGGQLPDIPSFESATIESGNIAITIDNGFGARLSFELFITDIASGTNLGVASFNIASGDSQTRNINLAGKSFGKSLEMRLANISSPGSGNGFNSSSALGFVFDLSNLQVSEITFVNDSELEYAQSITLPLDMPNDIELYDIAFSEGEIRYFVNTSLGIDLSVSVTLPSSTDGSGNPFTSTFTASNGNGSGSVDIINSRIDFTQGELGFNELPVEAVITIPVTGQAITLRKNNTVRVDADIRNVDFEELTGYLGTQLVDIEGDSLSLGVFENTLDVFEIDLDLVEPRLDFTVSSEYGVPFDFELVNTYADRNDGGARLPIELSPNPIPLEAGSIGNPSSTTVRVNNLNELFNFRPEAVFYEGLARLNPNGKAVNYINKDQRILIDVEAQVPLHGRLTLLSISDPTEVDLSGGESFEELESMELRVAFENGFPVDLTPQFYLYDEAGVLLDSVFTASDNNLFLAAAVGDDGIVTTPTTSDRSITISGTRLDNLLNTKSIVLRLFLQTVEDASKNVKILDSYRIKAQMGALATLKIDP